MSEKLTKLLSIHQSAIDSKQIEKMFIADMVMKAAIRKLSSYNEDDIVDLIEMYEGAMSYNNFLTTIEAVNICKNLKSKDGSVGPKWKSDVFMQYLKEMEFPHECAPYYNENALYVTVNMMASDFGEQISKWSGRDQRNFFRMSYDFAVAQLTDVDHPKWIRHHFDI